MNRIPNKDSDLEDIYGIEKPLVGKTLNIGMKKMKTSKLQDKKSSLAKKLSGGMKAEMSVKSSFPSKGMKPKMTVKSGFPKEGMKPVMNIR